MLARLRSILPAAAASGPTSSSSAAAYEALASSSSDALLPIAASSSLSSVPVPTLPFFVLGAAVLLPWNLILSSLPFFASLLAPSSALHASLPSTLSFTATGTNFVALAWITFRAGQARAGRTRELDEPTSDGGNSAGGGSVVVGRIRQSLLVLLLAFGFVQAFVILAPAEGQAGAVTVVVLGAWVVGVMLAGSYLQAAVISYASLFGPEATGAVMTGQGGIAVLVSTVQVLSAVVASRSGGGGGGGGGVPAGGGGLRWPTAGFIAAGAVFQLYTLFALKQITSHPAHHHALSFRASSPLPAAVDAADDAKPATSHSHLLDLARRNAPLNAAVALAFTVTLAVFPAVTAAVGPVGGATEGWRQLAIWVPVGFLTFNVGDCLGRFLPSVVLLRSPALLLTLSLLRTLFIPFFLACNVPSSPSPLPDAIFLAGLLLLGTSNGFVSSSALILASTPALNPRVAASETELAGTVAVFSLVGGLVLGSAASFGVVGLMGRVG